MQNAKLEQANAECAEVKWLHESCVVSVPADFNESDFDKPIIFVALTMAHVAISGAFVRSPGVKMTASSSPAGDRLEGSSHSLTPRIPGLGGMRPMAVQLAAAVFEPIRGRTPLCFERGER